MIDLKSVYKTFNRGKANQVDAIKGADLHVRQQEFLVIVGANGSGKTTLLNLVAGSVLPSSGSIYIDAHDASRLPDYKRSPWIARVFQNPLSGTASDLSIMDNFRLASIRTKSKNLTMGINEPFRQQVRQKIATLGMGLENKTEQAMGTLSGGQRQALTLLMSVMDSCKILLLDEPTAALDPRSAELVMKTADKLTREFGLTTILITHNLKEAFHYGNRIIQMAEGKIIKDLDEKRKSALKHSDIFDWFA